MVLHEPTVVKLNGYHRFAHLEESDFSTPTREVVKVTVKIVNQGDQVGLPGDSAIGGNGDFCQLFDDATDEPYGYKPNSASGWLKCRMDTTERAAGLYNFTIIQSEAYGESLVKSSAFLYDVDGTPFTVAVAPKVHSVYPPVGSAAGGTVCCCVWWCNVALCGARCVVGGGWCSLLCHAADLGVCWGGHG